MRIGVMFCSFLLTTLSSHNLLRQGLLPLAIAIMLRSSPPLPVKSFGTWIHPVTRQRLSSGISFSKN